MTDPLKPSPAGGGGRKEQLIDWSQNIGLDGGAPPILIYQMGKVGSLSIYRTLKTALLPNPIYHVHQLSERGLQRKKNWYRSRQVRGEELDLPYIERLMAAVRDAPESRGWRIITLTREPIGLEVSSFFENLSVCYADMLEPEREPNVPRILSHLTRELTNYDESRNYHCNWFDEEMKEVFGVDVYATPFPVRDGFTLLRRDNIHVLVLRVEDLDRCFALAINELLGLELEAIAPPRSNAGGAKPYAGAYEAVKRALDVPLFACDKIYNSKYARHFYSEEEIRGFIARWHKSPR